MTQVPLLNPQVESTVCREMVGLAASRLEELERQLTHATLDRETYIGKIATTLALRELIDQMTKHYNSRFNK